MGKKVKIGLIQLSSDIGNLKNNIEKALSKIEEASSEGAEIVCLPELFALGYNMNIKKLYSSDEVLKASKYAIKRISSLARKRSIYIIFPMASVEDNRIYNSAFLIDKSGTLLGKYDKVHLFEKERNIFHRGNEFKVWNTDIGKIGIMMCYDAGFPESARTLTLKGSEIIFCPSAWRIQDQMIWKLNIFQRAFENTVFVAGVNSVTKTETLHLFGESRIISPDGILISEAKMDKEEILISQIDLSDIEKHREKIQYLKDRNPEVYRMV